MAIIEGFRVQNYRALRDVTLGKLSGQKSGESLTPFTVVIGKNGAGKSSLFDAFGFVADCLATDVETACDLKQRGGFERLRSKGVDEPICFEIYYREAPNERPFVQSEVLKQRRKGQKHGRPFPFLRLEIKKTRWPLPGQVKHEWAEKIGPLLDPERNVSPSFIRLRDGLRRLVAEAV